MDSSWDNMVKAGHRIRVVPKDDSEQRFSIRGHSSRWSTVCAVPRLAPRHRGASPTKPASRAR